MKTTDSIMREIKDICTYHGEEGTSGYCLSNEQFDKLEALYSHSLAEARREVDWKKYSEQKPSIGQLVGCYRDIESRQIFVTEWSKEEERYAEMNKITHWFTINYPTGDNPEEEPNENITKGNKYERNYKIKTY